MERVCRLTLYFEETSLKVLFLFKTSLTALSLLLGEILRMTETLNNNTNLMLKTMETLCQVQVIGISRLKPGEKETLLNQIK